GRTGPRASQARCPARRVQGWRTRSTRQRAQLPEVPRSRRAPEGRHRARRGQHRRAATRAGGDTGVSGAPSRSGPPRRSGPEARLAGLDLLGAAVVVIRRDGSTVYLNPAAEQLFEVSRRILIGHSFPRLFIDPAPIESLLAEARDNAFGEKRTDLELERPGREPMLLLVTA